MIVPVIRFQRGQKAGGGPVWITAQIQVQPRPPHMLSAVTTVADPTSDKRVDRVGGASSEVTEPMSVDRIKR